jgi:hypothetical protein
MIQVGYMILHLDDDNQPLAPPSALPREQTNTGNQYVEIMRELNAKNDEVASLCAQRKDNKNVAIHFNFKKETD